MSKRRLPIWNYFTAGENDRFATCITCNAKVPRGGQTVKSFTTLTTNLVGHLKKHPVEYKKYEEEKATKDVSQETTPRARQLTLKESEDRSRVWATSDPRAVHISTKIGEMIALDCQPFFLVDDVGFVRLVNALEPRYKMVSRKYITETILPQIHSNTLSKVKDEITEAKWISCTSDIWSTEISSDSLLSLTAHWLTQSFK